jgi:hypothetical protein
MTIHTRLKRLEVKARRVPPAAADRWDDPSEEDWLELFEAWGQQGHFQKEPDFPTALAFYREALQRAMMQTDPPFDAPADFMPTLTDLPALRRLNWRNQVRFPDVHAGWDWLMEMLRREQEGIPPVSAAEFEELAHWFEANESRLYQISSPAYSLDVGEGRAISLANLRYGLRQGVRASGAGELAEDLRRLRARYGGGGT